MGNSFVLFYVSIVIFHGQFHCGNRGHTQNTDFPWVKSHFPVGKRSSGTTANDQGPEKALGFVSRKSRELFGPEKPVVKLQPACFERLIF